MYVCMYVCVYVCMYAMMYPVLERGDFKERGTFFPSLLFPLLLQKRLIFRCLGDHVRSKFTSHQPKPNIAQRKWGVCPIQVMSKLPKC